MRRARKAETGTPVWGMGHVRGCARRQGMRGSGTLALRLCHCARHSSPAAPHVIPCLNTAYPAYPLALGQNKVSASLKERGGGRPMGKTTAPAMAATNSSGSGAAPPPVSRAHCIRAFGVRGSGLGREIT
eukprot:239402-Rhodomonas_salina.1